MLINTNILCNIEQMYIYIEIYTHIELDICMYNICTFHCFFFTTHILSHTKNPKLKKHKKKEEVAFWPPPLKGKTPLRCSWKNPCESRGSVQGTWCSEWNENWRPGSNVVGPSTSRPCVRWHVFWAKDPLTTLTRCHLGYLLKNPGWLLQMDP